MAGEVFHVAEDAKIEGAVGPQVLLQILHTAESEKGFVEFR
jgi:hypothetical protein